MPHAMQDQTGGSSLDQPSNQAVQDLNQANQADQDLHQQEEDQEDQEDIFIRDDEIVQEIPDDGDAPISDQDEISDDDDNNEGSNAAADDDGMSTHSDPAPYLDSSIQGFFTHTQPIFAISVHPSLSLAATGGQDDLGYVFDFSSGKQVAVLDGHGDSVTCVAFSFDGSLVCTGGMDGQIKVWKVSAEGRCEFLTSLSGPDEINWLRWHPKGNVLLCGSADCTVWLFSLPSGETMRVFASHSASVTCGEWLPDGKRFITGSEDSTLILWDPKSTEPLGRLTAQNGHFAMEGGVTSMGVNELGTLAVVGGADGNARSIRIAADGKLDVLTSLEGHTDSVEVVQFADISMGTGQSVVATAGVDNKIFLWDLNTMRIRHTLSHDAAITSLQFHPAPNSHLFTSSSYDKTCKTWNAKTGELLKTHTGHQDPVNAVAISSNGSIITGGEDGASLVFSLES